VVTSARPGPEDLARAEAALPSRPVAWRSVARGQTPASRWVATLSDGSSAFVKIASTLDTAAWLRDEHLMYVRHRGRPFLPTLLGWHDDDERPVLALEDLSEARWPPPWDRGSVDAVLATLREVHATPPPPDLVPIDSRGIAFLDGWERIARDPEPGLALGLFDAPWFERHWERLHEEAVRAQIGGDSLLHLDVRSDNLCLRDGRAVLIDWNWAAIGNPAFDVAAWLPSLHAEGGPSPEGIMPDGVAFAAMLAGFFADRASQPPIPGAPRVRPLQLVQARAALGWTVRSMGLPAPSGARP
jgi:hypothetical protein